MTTATIEFDARPGPLRDAVARARRRMHAALEFARPDLGRPADVPDDPPALVSPKARRRRPVS